MRNQGKREGQALNILFGGMFIVGAISLVGLVGSMENDVLTIGEGVLWAIISLAGMGMGVVGLNRGAE